MIHHISIDAHDPLRVSQVFSELFRGQSIPFPGYPGSYVSLAFDVQGTMIEVHPLGTALFPGSSANEASQLQPNANSSHHTANHTAISVPVSAAQIQAIADREGWRIVQAHRGDYFDVIEFWVENRLLIELLPPEIIDQYLSFMEPRSLQQAAIAAASQTTVKRE